MSLNTIKGLLPQEKGHVFWLTGLSGSGKSTLAYELETALMLLDYRVMVIDGDHIRKGVCADLGYSNEDRQENVRRVAHIAEMFSDNGATVIVAMISPFAESRRNIKRQIGSNYFHEIYCACSLETCEERDPKGNYKKARRNEIELYTGIDSTYEIPRHPDLAVFTETQTVKESVRVLLEYILEVTD